MVILTGATRQYGNFITYATAQANKLGYRVEIYDLGGLGYGIDWETDQQFIDHGFYVQIGNWRSRALHKPLMVKHCLQSKKKFIAYLDADAILADTIDEVATDDYDIGVTVRRPGETCNDADYHDFFGRINAGVIFFNNTPASINFCECWEKKTLDLQNDQRALNKLINPHDNDINSGDTFNVGDVRIKCFSTEIYNFYYFPESPSPGTKILHYKDGLWKKLIK